LPPPTTTAKVEAMHPKPVDSLVCPVSLGPLYLSDNRLELISPQAQLAYPIRDGIPVLLEGQARTLSAEEANTAP